MRANGRTLGAIFAAFSLGGIVVVGYLAWTPELIRRNYGWDIADIGFVIGLLMAVFGTAGALFGGWFVDRLTRRGHEDAAIRASITGFGPTAIALVTDYVFHRDDALRWSMAIVGGACCSLALAILVWGRPAYLQSVRRAQQWLGRRGE